MKTVTTVTSGDIQLAAYTWGQPRPGQPAVLLVHGYPDSASIWEATATHLARDHYVIAYDVRGAGYSTVPKRVADFDMRLLVEDMAAVLDALSPHQPVHLVGHDWGSIQSWEAATTDRLKGRLLSYTTASGPSLDHMGFWAKKRLKNMSGANARILARQAAHSWYVYLFHMPVLAPLFWNTVGEKVWARLLEKVEGIHGHANPTQKGDGAVGVNLYKANIFQRVMNPQERHARIPVQLIVAKQDHFILPETFEDLPDWAPDLWKREIDAGHWIQISHPEWLAVSIREFIQLVEHGRAAPGLQKVNGPRAQQQAA